MTNGEGETRLELFVAAVAENAALWPDGSLSTN